MKDLITVIVPVYNVEQYVCKCVDSIINQTYKNLEIILVDDGSTDNSGNLCDEYVLKDSRIKVLHKENGGLSSARNAGIDVMNGNFVTFIDSDDWISSDYVEVLYNLIIKYNSDISVGNLKCVSDYDYVDEDSYSVYDINLNNKESIYEMLKERLYSNSACAKLYKKDIFKTLRFPNGKLYEDIPTIYNAFLSVDNVSYTNKNIYYYYVRVGSITKSKFNPRRMDGIYFFEEVEKNILNKYPDFKKICIAKEFIVNFGLFVSLSNEKDILEYKKIIKQNIRKLRWKVIFNKEAKFNIRVKAFLTIFGIKFLNFFKIY